MELGNLAIRRRGTHDLNLVTHDLVTLLILVTIWLRFGYYLVTLILVTLFLVTIWLRYGYDLQHLVTLNLVTLNLVTLCLKYFGSSLPVHSRFCMVDLYTYCPFQSGHPNINHEVQASHRVKAGSFDKQSTTGTRTQHASIRT